MSEISNSEEMKQYFVVHGEFQKKMFKKFKLLFVVGRRNSLSTVAILCPHSLWKQFRKLSKVPWSTKLIPSERVSNELFLNIFFTHEDQVEVFLNLF